MEEKETNTIRSRFYLRIVFCNRIFCEEQRICRTRQQK